MKGSDLSFLVVGAGAVGGITASFLKKAGIDVEIVCKYDDYDSLIEQKGLEVSGVRGDFRVKMAAYSSISQVKESKDIILLATKTTEMMDSAQSILPILKKGGHLVSLQNEICEDDLAMGYPGKRG